jgi:hypothetical protein
MTANQNHTWRKPAMQLGLFLMLGTTLSAHAGDTWKEEVLLHDGQKIIVERSQTYGGGHEIGQRPPVRDMTITFSLPGSGKRISWTGDHEGDQGRSNFMLAALHILNETPYVVALPNFCISYNKWGRPNPPYVIFKYQASAWTRISLAELPTEFKSTNLVVESLGHSEALARQGRVSAEMVKQLNGQMKQPEYRGILREPIKSFDDSCPALVSYGKRGGWIALDWFTNQPNLDACLTFCDYKKVSLETCPCNTIFGDKK